MANISSPHNQNNNLLNKEIELETQSDKLWRRWHWGLAFGIVATVILVVWSYLNFLCATVQISENQDANWLLNLFYGDRCKRSSGVANLPNSSSDNDRQQLILNGTSLSIGGGNTIDLSALVGTQGPAGPNGTSGSNGANGINGATGPAGPAGPVVLTNALTLSQAGGLTSTVNGVVGNQTLANGTVANFLGFDGAGNPVYEDVTTLISNNAITSINGQTGPAFAIAGTGPVTVTTGVNTATVGLAPCAIGQVYVYDGANWVCADENLLYYDESAIIPTTAPNASGNNSVAIGDGAVASGVLSMVFGSNSTASNTSSTAFGDNTTSSGVASTSGGSFSFATGDYSVALGLGVNSSNTGAFAGGVGTSALGVGSTAFGQTSTANGDFSFSGGLDNTASGSSSTTFGSNNAALGANSIAMGFGNLSNNDNSNTIGTGNTATGDNATAIGSNNTASGSNTSALGFLNNASGSLATAIGFANTATNSLSVSLGNVNNSTGLQSIALGNGTQSTGQQAITLGNNVNANGQESFSIGSQNTSTNTWDFTIGQFNTADGGVSGAVGFANIVGGNQSYAYGAQNTIDPASSFSIALGLNNDLFSSGYSLGSNNVVSATGASGGAIGFQNTVNSALGTALGSLLTVDGVNQTVLGTNNIASGSNVSFANSKTNDEFALILGNAQQFNPASNAWAVSWNGAQTTYGNAGNPIAVSPASAGRIYFDDTLQRFQCSENTGAYFDCFGGAAPIVSADNGLSINPANNVQLGGNLLQNTTITNNGFDLTFAGSSQSVTVDTTGALLVNTAVPTPGKVAVFNGDVDITGVIDPTALLFSDTTGVSSYNPATTNGFKIGTTGATNRPVYVSNFNNSTDTFQVRRNNDTTVVFDVDTLNNRVGINAGSTPSNTLHVVTGETAGVGTFINANSITTGAGLHAYSGTGITGTGSVAHIQNDSSSGNGVTLRVTNRGLGNALQVNDDGSPTDVTPFVVDITGNVGIQTAAPVAGLHNGSSTLYTTDVIANLPIGGNIGSASATVDIRTSFNVNQTTAGQTISLPNPSFATAGRIVMVQNTGSVGFSFLGGMVSPGSSASAIWNGTAWTLTGGSSLSGCGTSTVFTGVATCTFHNGIASNTFVGDNSGDLASTGTDNVTMGQDSGSTLTSGSFNTALGSNALTLLNAQVNNTAVGAFALESHTGADNTAVGRSALNAAGGGGQNVAIGVSALANTANGNNNVAVGHSALINNTAGSNNVAIGMSALSSYNGGGGLTAVGVNAGLNVTGAVQSVYFGRSAGSNAQGDNNTLIGYFAGSGAVGSTGENNTYVGYTAGQGTTTGSRNTASGHQAGITITSGDENSLFGNQAGQGLTTGNGNSFFGTQSGVSGLPANAVASGDYNTYLGYFAGPASATQRTNSGAIGSYATADCDNCLVLGSIAGINGAVSGTNIGIGTNAPDQPLSIVAGGGGGNNGLVYYVNGGTAGNPLDRRAQLQSTANGGQFELFGNAGNPIVRFGSNSGNFVAGGGHLGVGSTTVTHMLDVVDNTSGGAENGYVTRIRNHSTSTAANGLVIEAGSNTAPGTTFISLNKQDGTQIGSIVHGPVLDQVQYNTTSDIRLKENITETHFDLNTVLAIGVKDYSYRSDSTSTQTTGFIAQELFKLYPNAVTVGSDEIDANGNLVRPWQVDYSKLTPLLAKGIQDLNSKTDSNKIELLAKLADQQTQIVGISKYTGQSETAASQPVDNFSSLSARLAKLESSSTTQNTNSVATAVFNGGVVTGDVEFQGLATFAAAATFKAQAVFKDDVTFEANVKINGNLAVGENSTGTATIAAGSTLVHVSYSKPRDKKPFVTVSPNSLVSGSFAAINQTASGFDIKLEKAQAQSASFNWTALEK